MTSHRTRLAVTGDDLNGLEGSIGQHFGRCVAYTLIDVDDGRIDGVQVVHNPFVNGHQPGEVPRFIAGLDAKVLLTGGIGQRAITFFEQHGIEVSAGHTKTVAEAVDAWLAGTAGGPAACSGQHHGEGHHHGEDHHHGHGQCGRSS